MRVLVSVNIPYSIWEYIFIRYGPEGYNEDLENLLIDYGKTSIKIGKAKWYDPCFDDCDDYEDEEYDDFEDEE